MTSLEERPTNMSTHIGRVRWWVCGFLFFATTVNYIDRQVLSILKPLLQQELGWTEADYGWIIAAFQFGYALMMPIAGRLLDLIGTRIGYVIAVVVWSLASASHAMAQTVLGFAIARMALGIGEAANFPAAVKTVGDWFPQKERSFATGIFNSGSNVGLVIAAGSPFVAASLGWQAAFLLTGALGAVWVAAWLLWYRPPEEHPGLSAVERAHIEADRIEEPTEAVSFRQMLAYRGGWAFMTGKFMTDPVWWFFLFWIPSFLNTNYDVDLTSLGLPLLVIYLVADVGSIGGGWLFKLFRSWGWTANRSRKAAMFVCALSAMPVMGILFVETLWPAVLLISLAAAGHQGWSANLFTIVSDTCPRRATASVVGLGGLAGAVSGMLISPAVGYWLDFSGGAYAPLFIIGGMAYLTALFLIHLIVPRLAASEAS